MVSKLFRKPGRLYQGKPKIHAPPYTNLYNIYVKSELTYRHILTCSHKTFYFESSVVNGFVLFGFVPVFVLDGSAH